MKISSELAKEMLLDALYYNWYGYKELALETLSEVAMGVEQPYATIISSRERKPQNVSAK